MRRLWLVAMGVAWPVLAWSAETVVDGVTWHYEVCEDGARLVGGEPAYAGDLVVPDELDSLPVTAIDMSAFGFNAGVTSVSLPAGVTNVPLHAFCNSAALTNVSGRAACVHYGESSLGGTGLRSFAVPEGETELATDLFHNAAALETVTLPSTLRTMGRSCFYGCSALQEIRFPAGFASFGPYIDASQQPFAFCTALAHSYFHGPVPENFDCSGLLQYGLVHYPRAYAMDWESVVPSERFGGYTDDAPEPDADGVYTQTADGVAWRYVRTDDGARLVGGMPAYAGDLVVPDALGGLAVTAIDMSAFGFNAGVTSVSLPAGVTNVPLHAFCNSAALTNVSGRAAFVHYGESSLGGTGLRSFAVPEGETHLETDLFHDAAALETVTLPSTLRTMGRSCFYGCAALQEIRFPAGFAAFGAYVVEENQPFAHCMGLAHSYFLGPVPENFAYSGLLQHGLVHYPRAYAEQWAAVVPPERFGGYVDDEPDADGVYAWTADGVVWRYVRTDDGARLVGGNPAYAGDLVVPDALGGLAVKAIDVSAFGFNAGVTSVSLPAGVTNVPLHAFCNSAALTNVSSRAACVHYGESSLGGTGLRSFAVPEGETELATDLFHNAAALETVTLPSTLETMGRSCFYGCTSLREVEFPAGFVAFGEYAAESQQPFAYCTALEHSYFHGPVPENFACSGLLQHGLVHYPRAYAEQWAAVVPPERFGGFTDDGPAGPPPCTARGVDYVGVYDGEGHGISVEADADASVVYAASEADLFAGRNALEPPLFTNAVDATVWFLVTASNRAAFASNACVRIAPRPVTLASAGGWKIHDGTPLVKPRVVVGGMGFVGGDGVEVEVTGSQTEIGESDNVFTWRANPGTVTSNYEIVVHYGLLFVTRTALGTEIRIR